MTEFSDQEINKIREFVRVNDIDIIAPRLIFLLGFKSNLLGTEFLTECIVVKFKSTKMTGKQLYSEIAETYDTTPSRVERNIRHTLFECHAEGNLIILNKICRNHAIDPKYPPTTTQFVSSLCRWVWLEKSGDKSKTESQNETEQDTTKSETERLE